MKRTLISLAVVFAFDCMAEPLPAENIRNMVAQSEQVMAAGLCAVANDDKDYGAQTILVLLPPPVGARRILRNDYNWLRNAGYAKGASGRYVMSERVEQACREDALGGRCIAARSLWSQLPPTARPPGDGVKVK